MTPEDVADVRLIHPHTALVDRPYLDDGDSLIVKAHSDLMPKVFTRVLKTYGCDDIEVGDEVMFNPNAVSDYALPDGRILWAIHEYAISTTL